MSKLTPEKIRKKYGKRGYRKEKVLQFLYDKVGMSQSGIARVFDVSSSTVSRWLEKHGIEKKEYEGSIGTMYKIKNLIRKVDAVKNGRDVIYTRKGNEIEIHRDEVLKEIKGYRNESDSDAIKEKMDELLGEVNQQKLSGEVDSNN